ncbi:Xaa-Pro peptidase family protein [Roseomonas sp. AR75]|uniref:M24 family metallopeptidase n=1 Tax=Roseomonas sp. AR75 TaxID=2562311 RepID=UPI0010C05BB7|nr:Xaa-Pro peptidase family protein [Roseomonas sp. AR75]
MTAAPEPSAQDLLARVPQGMDCAFPPEEFARRQDALRKAMAAKGLDLYLTSSAENVYWLSGQQTPGYYTFQCLAIPLQGEAFLVNRGLETYNARANTRLSSIQGYDDADDPAVAVAEALKARGWKGKRVAIDKNAWFLTVNLYARLAAAFGEFEDGAGMVEPLRRVKSPLELASMEKAAMANDAGMEAGLALVKAGANENTIAAAVMQASIAAGGEYVGMEPFVVSGPRSGIPHATWRRRTIQPGDVTVLETAACYDRYHAALFRTVFTGEVEQRTADMYAVCLEALEAVMAFMKPGVTCAAVHQVAQDIIDRAGHTAGYRKRTGYSIGISFAPDWGEGNILSLYKGVDVPLEPGMVFHVPITLRDYARFTVAVSETVVVTESGCRPLSRLPRALIRR